MTKSIRLMALAAFVLTAPASVAGAAPGDAAAPERNARFGQELDSFIQKLRAPAFMPPGMAIVVVHGDQTIFEKAYGTRDNRTNAPLTLDTPMYNGSVTKAYTGVLAAILDAEGTLPLSATVKDIWGIALPPPLDAGTATAERLLSHSAEIDAGGLTMRSVTTGEVDAAHVPLHLARFAKPESAPGFEYNNYGPFIWSAMAEKRTGVPWRDLLPQKVLRPLGLTRSATTLEAFGAEAVARCHPRVAGAWRSDPPKPTALMNAAGGMYASPRDEAKFLKAMITDGASANGAIPSTILRRSWQRAAVQDRDLWGMHRDGYGLGWDLGSFQGHRFVSRSGGYPGCGAISVFFPALKFGVVAMSNGGIGANSLHAAIFGHALDLWTGVASAESKGDQRIRNLHKELAAAVAEADAGDPRLAKTKPIVPADWTAAEGAYRNERLGNARVVLDGDNLRLQLGVFSGILQHVGGDAFLLWDDPEDKATTFSFIRKNGTIVAFMLDDDRYDRVG